METTSSRTATAEAIEQVPRHPRELGEGSKTGRPLPAQVVGKGRPTIVIDAYNRYTVVGFGQSGPCRTSRSSQQALLEHTITTRTSQRNVNRSKTGPWLLRSRFPPSSSTEDHGGRTGRKLKTREIERRVRSDSVDLFPYAPPIVPFRALGCARSLVTCGLRIAVSSNLTPCPAADV